MSWSLSFIGTPDKIKKALEAESTRLTGESKTEYDTALPNILNLVALNYNTDTVPTGPILKLTANGHAYAVNGEKKYGSCNISIEVIHGYLV